MFVLLCLCLCVSCLRLCELFVIRNVIVSGLYFVFLFVVVCGLLNVFGCSVVVKCV